MPSWKQDVLVLFQLLGHCLIRSTRTSSELGQGADSITVELYKAGDLGPNNNDFHLHCVYSLATRGVFISSMKAKVFSDIGRYWLERKRSNSPTPCSTMASTGKGLADHVQSQSVCVDRDALGGRIGSEDIQIYDTGKGRE